MMLYTSVVRDVHDRDLMGVLGEHRSRGWEIRQLIPTSWFQVPPATGPGGGRVASVTHWLVLLESPRPLPDSLEIR